MAILRIHKQAHGRLVKEEKLAVSAMQSILYLLIPWLDCYTRRQLIQLKKHP